MRRWPFQDSTLLLLMTALALVWFANTGVRTLTEPDEGRYAEIPREMFASGHWGVPRLDGIQYLEKPPLQYWATATFYSVFGVRGWVSRLWTTALGFGCVLLVGLAGRRLYDRDAGVNAALLLASAPLFFGVGHINTLDMGLTFFLTAGLVAFLYAEAAAPASRAARSASALAWLALALAMLQKGLVAVVIPAFAVALYSLYMRDLRIWRRLHVPAGLALVLAVNLPWWVYMQSVNQDFLQFFFVHEHFARFATTEHQRQQPWWYLSAILLAGILPWWGPVVRGVLAGFRGGSGGGVRPATSSAPRPFRPELFLALWAAAVFLFYTPSSSKLAPYIVPMLPPLALLAGRELARARAGGKGLRSPLWLAGALALAMLIARPLAGQLLPLGEKRDAYLAVGAWVEGAGVALTLAVAAAAWLAFKSAQRSALVALSLGLVASFALLTTGTNGLERWRGGPYIAASVAPWLDAATPFYCVGLYPQTLTFALRRECTVVGYYGELEIQFDRPGRHYIAGYDQFLAEWAHASRAVAVVEPATWSALQSRGIPATIVAREPTAYVIVRSRADHP